jgi:hypothetical protein
VGSTSDAHVVTRPVLTPHAHVDARALFGGGVFRKGFAAFGASAAGCDRGRAHHEGHVARRRQPRGNASSFSFRNDTGRRSRFSEAATAFDETARSCEHGHGLLGASIKTAT